MDVLKYPGAYFGEIGLSREREWSPKLDGEAKISLGVANAKYNEVNIGARKNALNLDLRLTRILDHDLRAELSHPTLWNFALALGSDF